MDKPVISPNFTIEDIHKIREWNYERRKNMTFDEYQIEIKKSREEFNSIIADIKNNLCEIVSH